jgi:VanZ family protein
MIVTSRATWGWSLASLAYMASIFYLSSLPGSATGPNTPLWRFVSNVSHIPLFAGLGLCLAMALARWPWPSRGMATLVLGMAYAVFDEWHQSWVPGRTGSAADVLLDVAGILFAVLIIRALSPGSETAMEASPNSRIGALNNSIDSITQ